MRVELQVKLRMEGNWQTCVKWELCVDHAYFKQKSIRKYTKVARGRDGVNVMKMINLVMKEKLKSVQETRRLCREHGLKPGWAIISRSG